MSAAGEVIAALHAVMLQDTALMAALPGGIGDGGPGAGALPSRARGALDRPARAAGEMHRVTQEATRAAGAERALLSIAARLVALLPAVTLPAGPVKLALLDHRGTTTRRQRQGRLIVVEIRLLAITE